MSEKNEPAFPCKLRRQDELGDWETLEFLGVSMRDYFAAHALQGMLAGNDRNWLDVEYSHISSTSYLLADAMMKARGK